MLLSHAACRGSHSPAALAPGLQRGAGIASSPVLLGREVPLNGALSLLLPGLCCCSVPRPLQLGAHVAAGLGLAAGTALPCKHKPCSWGSEAAAYGSFLLMPPSVLPISSPPFHPQELLLPGSLGRGSDGLIQTSCSPTNCSRG